MSKSCFRSSGESKGSIFNFPNNSCSEDTPSRAKIKLSYPLASTLDSNMPGKVDFKTLTSTDKE
eukprot:CAMPEP_0115725952 /NCGR_PEP_ID=MMETSP0272-20121206/81578_1 /TAXON_ID=71861 /ORGANISM="Scrippsiella trochoidea, Strain CCMP3099" /LENGTH=63 /DNA_ID=CAMNT_0003169261 /DNA_START=178 /DNA_END=366 /DNA_ORIENTATION=-